MDFQVQDPSDPIGYLGVGEGSRRVPRVAAPRGPARTRPCGRQEPPQRVLLGRRDRLATVAAELVRRKVDVKFCCLLNANGARPTSDPAHSQLQWHPCRSGWHRPCCQPRSSAGKCYRPVHASHRRPKRFHPPFTATNTAAGYSKRTVPFSRRAPTPMVSPSTPASIIARKPARSSLAG